MFGVFEKLAELYESEQQWSKAAQILSGIDLDSGIR
jgi:COP9 signalosome complex subunit 4